MALIPFPDGAGSINVSIGLQVAQSVLEGQGSRTRQVLFTGFPRWQGQATIRAFNDDGRKQLQAWLARMSRGDNWTTFSLGVMDEPLHPATRFNVLSSREGVVSVGGPDLIDLISTLPGRWLSTGTRTYLIAAAVDRSPSRQPGAGPYEFTLEPNLPVIPRNTILQVVTSIEAYAVIGTGDPIYQTHNVDWANAFSVPWVEKVT